MRKKTDYEILGVEPGASLEEIRRAYKDKARQLHPDRNREKDTTAKFQRLVAAYERLSKACDQEANQTDLQLAYQFSLDQQGILKEDQSPSTNHAALAELLAQYTFENAPIPDNLCTKSTPAYWDDNFEVDEFRLKEAIDSALNKYSQAAGNQSDNSNLKEKSAFLWQAEKPGVGKILLLSSIHYPVEVDFDPVRKALHEVDEVYTEVPILTATAPSCLDKDIAQEAIKMNKVMKSLENEAVVAYIDDKVKDLSNPLPDMKNPDSIISLLKNYFEPNRWPALITHLSASLEQSRVYRNQYWVHTKIIPTSLAGKKSLIVSGYLHNTGENGLPSLLAKEGYHLTPLISNPPRSEAEREVVRNLAGYGQTSFNRPPKNNSPSQELVTQKGCEEKSLTCL